MDIKDFREILPLESSEALRKGQEILEDAHKQLKELGLSHVLLTCEFDKENPNGIKFYHVERFDTPRQALILTKLITTYLVDENLELQIMRFLAENDYTRAVWHPITQTLTIFDKDAKLLTKNDCIIKLFGQGFY